MRASSLAANGDNDKNEEGKGRHSDATQRGADVRNGVGTDWWELDETLGGKVTKVVQEMFPLH